jgi:polysaccharide export outer membrane protein
MFRSAVIALSLASGTLIVPANAQDQKPATQLVQYIRDAQRAGLKVPEIRQNAIKAGWAEEAVDGAIGSLDAPPRGLPPDIAKMAAEKPAAKPASSDLDGGTPKVAQQKEPDQKPVEQKPTEAKPAEAEGAAAPKAQEGGAANPEAEALRAKSAAASGTEYQIGEGDILQVAVWGEPTASVQSVTVRTDGKISMPLIKEVQVAGLTPAQVEATVQDQLGKMIKAPDVTVIVVQINSKKIYLTGAVKREGPLKYTYRMTVLQAISEAGGLTDYAKRKKIYVLHHENGREYKLPFDYSAVLKGERMEQNIFLSPGDHIVVP